MNGGSVEAARAAQNLGVISHRLRRMMQSMCPSSGRLVSSGIKAPSAGSVSRVFDNNFRVTSQSVNGANPISFGYDTDDLLTSAGGMTLSRSSATGLLTGAVISNATDSYS